MPDEPLTIREQAAMRELENAARAYAEFSHGNLSGIPYRRREEARERLRDALATLDLLREKIAA